MAPGQKNGEKGKSASRSDATLAFMLPEPSLEGPRAEDAGFISAPLKLYSLKQQLSRFRIYQSNDTAGFNYDNFVKNIRRMSYGTIGGLSFDILATRHSYFLTINGEPQRLIAVASMLRKDASDRLSVAKADDGELLSVLRLDSEERKAITKALSGRLKSGTTSEFFISPEAQNVGMSDLKNKLNEIASRAPGRSITASEAGFDLAEFCSRIEAATLYKDEKDMPFLEMDLKGDALMYHLYVNSKPSQSTSQNPMVCTLQYNKDVITVYRIEVVC